MSDDVTQPIDDPVIVSTSERPWWGSPAVALYSLTIFLACLVIAYMKGSDNLLTILLGVAAANATTAVQYYLGSSAGSQRKDQLIHRALRRPC